MASTPACQPGATGTRRSATHRVNTPATRTGMGSARGTSTPSRVSGPDPPPVAWSILKYGSCEPKEDHDAEEEPYARRDRVQAAPSRCPGCAGNPGRGCDPLHRGRRGHVLSLASGVRRAQVEPGQAHEGAGD